MTSPYSVLNDQQIAAIVCNQWGDTGKGKFVDLYAAWADVIARGTGGNNAGHTIKIGDEEIIFHLIPSSILHDGDGKISIMGSGMVDDLGVVVDELDQLDQRGQTYNGLRISDRAQVILPYHKQMDGKQSSMAKGKIGTTGKGVGPAYADWISRVGIRVGDLRDRDLFVRKLGRAKEHHAHLGIEIEAIVEEQLKYFERIKEFVCDTDVLLRGMVAQGKKVLLEGAQGLLLSIDYGTYPHVTSSDCSRYGSARGVGLLPEQVGLTLGITKFPFMTRVGNGPFPTEYGGRKSESYCAEGNGNAHKRPVEEREFGGIDNLINDPDEFKKGVGVRLAAGEYGATTRRPRRTGRTDLEALRHAMRINGYRVILTKTDCVRGMDELELGDSYQDESGTKVPAINHGSDITYGLKGIYTKFPGFEEDISGCRSVHDLPDGLRKAIAHTERTTGARVDVISVGPEAGQTISV